MFHEGCMEDSLSGDTSRIWKGRAEARRSQPGILMLLLALVVQPEKCGWDHTTSLVPLQEDRDTPCLPPQLEVWIWKGVGNYGCTSQLVGALPRYLDQTVVKRAIFFCHFHCWRVSRGCWLGHLMHRQPRNQHRIKTLVKLTVVLCLCSSDVKEAYRQLYDCNWVVRLSQFYVDTQTQPIFGGLNPVLLQERLRKESHPLNRMSLIKVN